MKENANPGIFTSVDEKLNLLIPILLLIPLLFEGVTSTFLVSERGSLQNRILVDIFLLNVTHNAFTYLFLMCSEQMRPWVLSRGSARGFWSRIAEVNLVLSALIFGLFYFGQSYPWVRIGFSAIAVAFGIHHALSQSFGLSLLYNRKLPASKPVEDNERRERRLFVLFLVSTLLLSAHQSLHRHFHLPPEVARPIRITFSYLMILSGIALILNALLFPRCGRLRKFAFSARYLIWIAAFSSPLALFATGAIHGLEYTFVTRKMLSASKVNRWLYPGLGLVLLVIVLAYYREVFLVQRRGRDSMPLGLIALASISFAVTFSHYYLDRALFKMRHRVNQETTGRLLVTS